MPHTRSFITGKKGREEHKKRSERWKREATRDGYKGCVNADGGMRGKEQRKRMMNYLYNADLGKQEGSLGRERARERDGEGRSHGHTHAVSSKVILLRLMTPIC